MNRDARLGLPKGGWTITRLNPRLGLDQLWRNRTEITSS